MLTQEVKDVIEEINIQKEKPLEEQLEDFKIAGAKLIVSLDKYIKEVNNK